jgi:hypothetical protein
MRSPSPDAALSALPPQAGPNLDVALGTGVAGSAAGAFLTVLVVGAIMIAVRPDATERLLEDVLEDPVASFVYGIVALLALFVVVLVLVLSIVGLLVAVPLLFAAYVVWAVGAVVAYLAIADRLVGREDGWLKPLVLAAALNGLLTLTGVGGIVSLCVGAAGFGAVLRAYFE